MNGGNALAIYRQLHTTFWKDKRVGEWNKDQKLFFLYLLSNDYTTQCGVYEFNKRYAKFELDMTTEEINKQLDFLVSEGRIVFNEKAEELMIVNWLKYNSARSPKVAAVIDKELREVKTLEFEKEVIRKCLEYGYPIQTEKPKENTVSIGYRYGIDTISQPASSPATASEPTPATADNKQTPSAETATAASENMFQAYQRLFGHPFSAPQATDMQEQAADISEPVVIEAMRRSALKLRDYAYASGIMRSWSKKGVKSMSDVDADDNRFELQQQSKKPKNIYQQTPQKVEKMPDWDNSKSSGLTPEQQAEMAELEKMFND